MKNTILIFTKILIVFSIFLIISGVVLFVYEDDKSLKSIDVGDEEEKSISITTLDTDEQEQQLIDFNAIPSQLMNIDGEEEINSETIEISNQVLRKEIENTYGVVVKYGSETEGYNVGGMSTIAINDPMVAQIALTNLDNALSLYPVNFFKEVSKKSNPLTIYLVRKYSVSNVTGVTDSDVNDTFVSIAIDYDFFDTFHHEIYHYVEKYIFSTGFKFNFWNMLNPVDFNYGNVNSNYSYAKTFAEDSYFVNSYAMTNEFEDRASTFEYMMKTNKVACLNNGNKVWLKASKISEQLDYYLDTVTLENTEYWERFLLG